MNSNRKSRNKSSFLPVLIIAIIAIGLYSNTLKNGFVYDDKDIILNNTLIKSFDNLPLLFSKTAYFSRSEEMSYRPVVTFTYFIDYALYGLNSWGYHLTNILLHAINGALLYFFLTLLLTPHSSRLTSLPFLISLLFVAHPVLTEAVNCISYREDLLAFLFYIITLSLYLILRKLATDRRPRTTVLLYLLSCPTYLLALLSKEMAVTLPLIVLFYEWLYGKDKKKLSLRLFNYYVIGYIIITLLYLYLRFYLFYNTAEQQIRAWGLIEKFLTMPWLIMNYLKLSLFPIHLSADYVIVPVSSPFSPNFILSIIVIVSIFTIIVTVGSRARSVLFGALFFLTSLTPVYNLVPVINPFIERYLYLPLVGFIISAVCIIYLISEKLKISPAHRNRYMPIVFLVVSIIFSFSVVKRNAVWRDNYSLWSDTVVKMPNSARAHYNLGIIYRRQGLFDQAIREYLAAIRLKPDGADVHYNLGLAYFKQGRYDEAIYELKTVLRLKQDDADSHYALGDIYFNLDVLPKAIQEYSIALKLKPFNAIGHYRLGNAYARIGLKVEARKEFETVLRLAPGLIEARKALESLD